MKRNFTEWLSTFRNSIADYGYYIDFEKVHCNVNEIKVELNILNSLIGSHTIEKDFEKLAKSLGIGNFETTAVFLDPKLKPSDETDKRIEEFADEVIK